MLQLRRSFSCKALKRAVLFAVIFFLIFNWTEAFLLVRLNLKAKQYETLLNTYNALSTALERRWLEQARAVAPLLEASVRQDKPLSKAQVKDIPLVEYH